MQLARDQSPGSMEQCLQSLCPSWSLTGTDVTASVTPEGAKKCSKDGLDGVEG